MSDHLASLQLQAIKLIESKNSVALKKLVVSCGPYLKGPLFEFVIRDLYSRNGWLATQVGGCHDKGADVLLYSPSSPEKVSFVVQAKNHNKPLGIDAVRTEMIKFEHDGSEEYQCQNYKLVSATGFTRSAKKKMRGFNIDLCDWDYVVKLIRNADGPWSKLSPTIELSANNRDTYRKIHAAWGKSHRVAAVQATGTGKSYLIAKAIVENQTGRVLLMAPRTTTIKRQLKKTPWLDGISHSTYHALSIGHQKFTAEKFDLIVLDEFHRIGAPEWQQSVLQLLENNPEALVLGTSATHIRFLDKCRDMAQEIFNGNVVFGPNLPEAIATRLLPNPTYVTAFYSLENEIERVKEKITLNAKGPIQNSLLQTRLKNIQDHWGSTQQVSSIVSKHIDPKAKKYIVFCESIEHLNAMEPQVSLWLKQALRSKLTPYINVKSHAVHSGRQDSENEAELLAFEHSQPGPGEVELIFTVDMLNESIHMKDIDGVFLLRKTTSPVIYLQQIGRTLACDGCETPIIFDLVDNSGTIKYTDFQADLAEESKRYNERRRQSGLPTVEPVQAVVHDYVTEMANILKDLLNVFDPWESRFQQLVEYHSSNGHCNVPQRASALGKWINHQRTLFSKGLLSEEKVARMSSLGFAWSAMPNTSERMISYLRGVYEETGTCPFKTGDPDADRWMTSMRRMYRGNTLPDERINELNEIEFVWSHNDKAWKDKYYLLRNFYREYGHSDVPKAHPELGRWVRAQRENHKALSFDRLLRLEGVNFRWRHV